MIRAGVIGHPINHSLSPKIHMFWLNKLGIEGHYQAIDVPIETLKDFCTTVLRENFKGVNVTLPHKINAVSYCDQLTDLATTIGAVNILVVQETGEILGHNSDVGGFSAPLLKHHFSSRLKACVLGAGGAARAVVAGLSSLGFSDIHVVNRTPDRIAALVTCAGRAHIVPHTWNSVAQALQHAHIIVNTTSLGMVGHAPLEIDLTPVNPNAVVYDLVYTPLETPLLSQARVRGLHTYDGLEMLIGQAAEAFALFFGPSPDRADDIDLRRCLVP